VMDELGKLTKAAGHAYLPSMAELGAKIHSVYEVILAGQLPCSPTICDSLNRAHTALLDMVDAIAAGQNLGPIPEMVDEALDELLTTEVVTLTTFVNDDVYSADQIPLIDQIVEEQPDGIGMASFNVDLLESQPQEETRAEGGD